MKIILVPAVILAILVFITWQGFVSIDITAFLAFVTILGTVVYIDRKNVKREGVALMRRTEKGKASIDTIAKKHPTFWNALFMVGVIIGIPMLFISSGFLIMQGLQVLSGSSEGGVRLILPGPVANPVNAPGVFILPWWIWIIGIASVIIPHELSHGIACRLDKIKIKSVGWVLLLIIPGAFVEPDEAQLQKAKRMTKMKVYAAGAFANIVIAFLIFMVFAITFPVFFTPAGLVMQTVDGSPANGSGISPVVTAINGEPIYSRDDVVRALEDLNPGDQVVVRSRDAQRVIPTFRFSGPESIFPQPVAAVNGTEHDVTVTLGTHPEKGTAFLGVAPVMLAVTTHVSPELYVSVALIFFWIYVFSMGIGLVNLLPIKPLDGGLLFEEVVGALTPHKKIVVQVVSGFMILVLLFNLLGPLVL